MEIIGPWTVLRGLTPDCEPPSWQHKRTFVLATSAPVPARSYRWVWNKPEGMKGAQVKLLAVGTMNSCLIEFPNGLRLVTSRNGLRRIRRETAPDPTTRSGNAAGPN